MLRCDKSLRLTVQERAFLQELGIDPEGIRSPSDFANALAPWLDALGEVRPDLINRLAREIIKARNETKT